MSTGFAAYKTITVSYDYLKENFPVLIQEIEEDGDFPGWGDFAGQYPNEDETPDELVKKMEALEKAFNEKTGLTLELGVYVKDNGDIYDEVEHKDGCMFCVDGVYQLTKAGEKMQEHLHHNSFVALG